MALPRLHRRWLSAIAVASLCLRSQRAAKRIRLGSIAHLPHDLSPWGMFHVGRHHRAGRDDRPVRRFRRDLDGGPRQEPRADRRQPAPARRRCAGSARKARCSARSTGSKAAAVWREPCSRRRLSEVRLSGSAPDPAGVKERVASHLTRIEAAAGRGIARGTGVLATIGSTAPFVGLFGTVWGIMNSFIGISKAQTTNLAVVAPGIAEALLATAIGLVAAIPAVIIYNQFARWTAGYRALVGDTSAHVQRLVSRDMDRAAEPAARDQGSRVDADGRPHRRRRRRTRRIARDQRHAVHRRDAGAADHLHGGGAAVDRRRARRPAGLDRQAAAAARQAALPDDQVRPVAQHRQRLDSARAAGLRDRGGDAVGQGQTPVPARRPDRAVWRADERAQHAARRRLPEDRPGRAGRRRRRPVRGWDRRAETRRARAAGRVPGKAQ